MQLPLRENYRIAIESIKGQLLRALLTMFIIAIGIMSLVGTLTAIDAMRYSISSNFQNMGANTFTIRNREMTIRIGRGGKKPKKYPTITFQEAVDFKRSFHYPAYVSVSTIASFNSTLKYKSEKSNPNVQVFGADENYLMTSGYTLKKGRNFSPTEIESGAHLCLLGADMVSQLFSKTKEDPLGKVITVGNGKYLVIGVLGSKGNTFGFGGDKIVILPLLNVRQYFSQPNMTFTINVLARDATQLDATISEATGVFRVVRKVPIGEEDNFEIAKSDSLSNLLNENLSTVYFAATAIGIITLIGAAIGLMNIMLVSVTERTREIGTRKALGATRSVILRQFLMESVVISILGGLGGILLGIIVGNLLMMQLSGTFVVPWTWMFGGVTICFFVGIISGIGPALKASRMDPIEALRFE